MTSGEKLLRRQWRTPQNFFDKLNREFNFQLDAAASKENTKCEKYYTEAQDSLSDACPWITKDVHRVFINPGFNDIGPWVKKAYFESLKEIPNTEICVLSLVSPSTDWWMKWVNTASEIRLIGGKRIQFEPPDETIKKSSNARENCVIIYRGKPIMKPHPPYVWTWDWTK